MAYTESKGLETQGIMFNWHGKDVGEVVSFTGPGGSASVIDVSNLQSLRREKRMGLPDEGQFTMECNLVIDDEGQELLLADRALRLKQTAILTLTDTAGTTLIFDAYCLGFSIAGAVDDKIRASITLEITGEVKWSSIES